MALTAATLEAKQAQNAAEAAARESANLHAQAARAQAVAVAKSLAAARGHQPGLGAKAQEAAAQAVEFGKKAAAASEAAETVASVWAVKEKALDKAQTAACATRAAAAKAKAAAAKKARHALQCKKAIELAKQAPACDVPQKVDPQAWPRAARKALGLKGDGDPKESFGSMAAAAAVQEVRFADGMAVDPEVKQAAKAASAGWGNAAAAMGKIPKSVVGDKKAVLKIDKQAAAASEAFMKDAAFQASQAQAREVAERAIATSHGLKLKEALDFAKKAATAAREAEEQALIAHV